MADMTVGEFEPTTETEEVVLFVDGSAPLTHETKSLLLWLTQQDVSVTVLDAVKDPIVAPLLNDDSADVLPIMFANGRVLGGRLLREAMTDSSRLLSLLREPLHLLRRVDCLTLVEWLNGSTQPFLVDTRTEREYLEERIAGARRLDTNLLEALSLLDRRTRLVFYCNDGVKSLRVARHHLELGFTDVSVLSGGIVAWKQQFGRQNSSESGA